MWCISTVNRKIHTEMALPKLIRLPSVRLLSSIHQHQLLLPSIAPHTVPRRAVIQGKYRRPGQPKEDKFPWEKINFSFSKGLEGIKKNFTLMKKELSDRWVGPEGKPILEHMLEQNRVVWEFRGLESLNQWTVSSDREIGGQSEAYLKLGRNDNTCLLYGTLNSTPPRDGETRYSGYCAMRSRQPLVSALLRTLLLYYFTDSKKIFLICHLKAEFTDLFLLCNFETLNHLNLTWWQLTAKAALKVNH